MKFRLSPRLALVIIAAMFVLPLILAWLMYSGAIDYRPASTRNLGWLVQPPVPITWPGESEAILTGHWVVLHAVPDPCKESCIAAVTGLRQVHRAAGRNQSRIRMALLLPDPPDSGVADSLRDVYAAFELLERAPAGFRDSLEQIAESYNPGVAAAGGSYLVDPLGNIMMFYATGFEPNDLKKDLKRLLTWSKLDEQ